jgi:hypothetical protein
MIELMASRAALQWRAALLRLPPHRAGASLLETGQAWRTYASTLR